jgi:hypothetical protein
MQPIADLIDASIGACFIFIAARRAAGPEGKS